MADRQRSVRPQTGLGRKPSYRPLSAPQATPAPRSFRLAAPAEAQPQAYEAAVAAARTALSQRMAAAGALPTNTGMSAPSVATNPGKGLLSAPAAPAASISGDTLSRLRLAIRSKESGGNYNARGQATKYGVARGAYQFLPSTYLGFARQAGVDPNDWSPEAQDKVAMQAMSTYLRQFGGDPRKVAIAWYAGPGAVARSAAALNARQSAGGRSGNMPSINAYAADIIRRMGT